MVLTRAGAGVLEETERDVPMPHPGEVLVKIAACGVCRTDLHLVAGELPDSQMPIVPGHEIVGRVEQLGAGVHSFAVGDRVGIPWLGYTCEQCAYCRSGRENLCPEARFTGYQRDGGYAECAVVDARYAFGIPEQYGDAEAARFSARG